MLRSIRRPGSGKGVQLKFCNRSHKLDLQTQRSVCERCWIRFSCNTFCVFAQITQKQKPGESTASKTASKTWRRHVFLSRHHILRYYSPVVLKEKNKMKSDRTEAASDCLTVLLNYCLELYGKNCQTITGSSSVEI